MASIADEAAEDDNSGSGNPDPTMKKLPNEPSDENVPPAGGESMAPADSPHPFAKPGGAKDEGAGS